MTWTTPKTWTNEPLVASDLNTHLRDNLEALKNLPSYTYNSASNYSTTSTSPVMVDSSNMNETITLESTGNVLVGFNGTANNSGGSHIFFYLQQNGVTIMQATITGGYHHIPLEILLEDLPPGDYTYSLLWSVATSTGILPANNNHFYVQGL